MKIAECYCEDCRTHFKIKFKKSIPPWPLLCPVCGTEKPKICKLDGDANE